MHSLGHRTCMSGTCKITILKETRWFGKLRAINIWWTELRKTVPLCLCWTRTGGFFLADQEWILFTTFWIVASEKSKCQSQGILRNICQVSCRMFLNGSVSGFFITRLGLQGFERKTMGVKRRLHHVILRVCAVDMTDAQVHLITWLRRCLLDLCKVSLSSLFSHVLFGRRWPCTGVEGHVLTCWQQSICINYLESFCMTDLSVLCHSIYLFIGPFIYLNINS